jgi:RNA polymerase sigma-70 factor (ECF subfamily)
MGRLPPGARDLVDTDDLVQEVLGQTIRRLGRFEYRRTRALQAYVRVALDNRIREELRHRHPFRDETGDSPSLPDPAPGPLQHLVARELVERYESALARLRPGDREAVFAKLELGCDYPQIADALGKPTAEAARKAVARAVVRLAREMSRAR